MRVETKKMINLLKELRSVLHFRRRKATDIFFYQFHTQRTKIAPASYSFIQKYGRGPRADTQDK